MALFILKLGARWGGRSVTASTNKDVYLWGTQSKQTRILTCRSLSIGFSTLSFPSVKGRFRKTDMPEGRKFTM
jgi:hypothetical protein